MRLKHAISLLLILAALATVFMPNLMRAYSLNVDYPHQVECSLFVDGAPVEVFYVYPKSLKNNDDVESLKYSAKKTDVPEGLDVFYKVSDRGAKFEVALLGNDKMQSSLACSSAEMLPKIVLQGNI